MSINQGSAGQHEPAQRESTGRAIGEPTGQTVADRAARGRAARTRAPRSSHGRLATTASRPDPLALLEQQAQTRVPELVPIRYGRMLASPFAFYRGAALIMANDLAGTGTSGIVVQSCGDAHLSNFGVFASPERRLVFDINDFDETHPGPWEWDIKRLVASFEVAGRDNGFAPKERRRILLATTRRYRTAMRRFAEQSDLDVWYAHADTDEVQSLLAQRLDKKRRVLVAKGLDKARTRDSMQAFGKLTTLVDGERRIVADRPLVVPIAELLPDRRREELDGEMQTLLRGYLQTLQPDRRVLVQRYRFVDMAHKVVGVGSVGTLTWIVLLTGRDANDPLFLQVKEAQPSVLERFTAKSEYANQGQRVVAGQRLMQAASDIFLGWQSIAGPDGRRTDFYVRQLRDWKGSVPIEEMLPVGLTAYGELCAWTLARAHARSGDRIAIAAYLGGGDVFDRALADFAEAYADQNDRDYRALQDAVKTGRLVATDA
jgi:uncharacterized protein (DUF2252 family)